MSENLETDIVALRREARRRRILENSENRLKSIAGKSTVLTRENKPSSYSCYRSHCEDVHENHNVFVRDFEQNLNPIEKLVEKDLGSSISGIFNHCAAEVQQKAQEETYNTFLAALIKKRFHYIILSVIVNLLLLSDLGFLFYNNVFCPFTTLKVVELILVQGNVQKKNTEFQFLATICRGSSVAPFLKAFSIVITITPDFFLYMFTFVICDKLLSALMDS